MQGFGLLSDISKKGQQWSLSIGGRTPILCIMSGHGVKIRSIVVDVRVTSSYLVGSVISCFKLFMAIILLKCAGGLRVQSALKSPSTTNLWGERLALLIDSSIRLQISIPRYLE